MRKKRKGDCHHHNCCAEDETAKASCQEVEKNEVMMMRGKTGELFVVLM